LQVDFLDLVNSDEKLVFNNIFHEQKDRSHTDVKNLIIGNQSDTTVLYERIIEELKQQIEQLKQEVIFLRELLSNKSK
jgi:predicted nucleic acid-binding OB-fold protein